MQKRESGAKMAPRGLWIAGWVQMSLPRRGTVKGK